MHRLWTRLLCFAVMTLAFSMPAHAGRFVQLQSYIGWQQPVRLCVQPEGGMLARNGAVIREVPCASNDESQFWETEILAEEIRGGILTHRVLFQNVGTGQCLDLTDGNTADWTPLQQWPCNSTSTTMQWIYHAGLESNPNAFDPIINRRSGKCMDVRGGSSLPGTVIQNYHCGPLPDGLGNPAQFWRLIPR